MKKINDVNRFLLDMDGTIYLGEQLIDGAKEFLEEIRKNNKEYLFLTNNSSKDKSTYVEKLRRLGIQSEEEDVFSSGDATIYYLKKYTDFKRIFLLGTSPLAKSFKRAGFELVEGRDKDVDCVVLGFDTTLTYDKLWAACDYVKEVPYIATHPDINCPIEGNKVMPDAGAIIAFIKASTGREPVVIGKPNEYMLEAIMDAFGLQKKDLAIVGDRLYTDIKMGQDLGILSVLVLSGETTAEDYEKSPVMADYVFDSVADIPLD